MKNGMGFVNRKKTISLTTPWQHGHNHLTINIYFGLWAVLPTGLLNVNFEVIVARPNHLCEIRGVLLYLVKH
ncbi:hypothetical protein BDZ45DRAFT_674103 [Acephala macrosclerotiorum]|nr:hypothetical protein BDZ45DRAFT_674103 [Acephala macrosclerotiorum]